MSGHIDDTSPHPYIPSTYAERAEMLEVIGVESVDQLFADVPEEARGATFDLPPPLAEPDLLEHYARLAAENVHTDGIRVISFLGNAATRHAIPSVVPYITGLGDFLTAYTPYQPEVSQGTLEAAFLFQTLMCELTGMEACNTGMYDGASALAEAALMAVRLTKRSKVTVMPGVRPIASEVVTTYCQGRGIELVTPARTDQVVLDEETAAVLIQSPNYLGTIENLEEMIQAAHAVGAKAVVSAEPLSMAMFKPPGEYGADIVVGEAQPLGIAMNFGGPHLGFLLCNKPDIRQMPGRIVGATTDVDGKPAYVLTLQAREQHIRRESATSNICTSQQLVALAATVYMTLAGKNLAEIARQNYHKAHYAADRLSRIPGLVLPHSGRGIFFNEFVMTSPLPTLDLNQLLLRWNIIGGNDVSDAVPKGMKLAVTETHNRGDIEHLTYALQVIADENGWAA